MSGYTTGAVRGALRLEGLTVFVAALFFYHGQHFDWGMFMLLFLVPDLSCLGYLSGPRIGALMYNSVHSYIGPIVVTVVGFSLASKVILSLGLIWLAHIGFDRMLGYGLKYPTGFHSTHLGNIGRQTSM